jgi:hypothetical protein
VDQSAAVGLSLFGRRHFVDEYRCRRGQVLAGVNTHRTNQVGGCRGSGVPDDDRNTESLAGRWCGHGHRIEDLGKCAKRLLDVCGEDRVPRYCPHVSLTAADVQVAVSVAKSGIARAKPTVFEKTPTRYW